MRKQTGGRASHVDADFSFPVIAIEHEKTEGYPVLPDMAESDANVAYTMLYGYSTQFEIFVTTDEYLEVLLSSNVPRVAHVTESELLNDWMYWTVMNYDKDTKMIQMRNPWGIM